MPHFFFDLMYISNLVACKSCGSNSSLQQSLFICFESMARTQTNHQRRERMERKVLWMKERKRGVSSEEEGRPPSPVHHPSPAKEALTCKGRWRRWWKRQRGMGWGGKMAGGCGKVPVITSPTQQLAQMAVETGPSASGEEPVKRKLLPYCGRQSIPEGVSSRPRKVKKTRKYWPGTVALQEICWFQKSTEAPHQETPLLTASPWDKPKKWANMICASKGAP